MNEQDSQVSEKSVVETEKKIQNFRPYEQVENDLGAKEDDKFSFEIVSNIPVMKGKNRPLNKLELGIQKALKALPEPGEYPSSFFISKESFSFYRVGSLEMKIRKMAKDEFKNTDVEIKISVCKNHDKEIIGFRIYRVH